MRITLLLTVIIFGCILTFDHCFGENAKKIDSFQIITLNNLIKGKNYPSSYIVLNKNISFEPINTDNNCDNISKNRKYFKTNKQNNKSFNYKTTNNSRKTIITCTINSLNSILIISNLKPDIYLLLSNLNNSFTT